MKILEAIDSALWAIDGEWLLRIRAIALGEGEGPEALAARLGRPLQNTQTTSVRSGVAVIPITGPVLRYGNVFSQASGATSIDVFARDLRAALDDPAISSVLFEINSPGGQVDGINEAAAMIAGSDKPTAAYIGGMATSAAYWLASAADRVVVDATARLGGIGVVVAINRDKKAAEGVIEIVSSQSPLKRPDVLTPEGRSSIQGQVDAIADVFIDSVAKYRAVERETVLAEFGQGSVKIGEQAVAAGMADTVGSFESTLRDMIAAADDKRRGITMAKAETATMSGDGRFSQADLDAAVERALAADREKTRAEAREEGSKAGVEEGIKSERDRIMAIDKICLPGHETLAEEAKLKGWTAADFSMKQAETEKHNRAQRLEAIKRDGRAAAEVASTASATGEVAALVADDPSRPLAERCRLVWDRDAKLRDEFLGEFENYLHFRMNDEAGRIRILRRVGD